METPDSDGERIPARAPDETELARDEEAPQAKAVPRGQPPAKPGVEAGHEWDSVEAAFAAPQSMERQAQAILAAGDRLRAALEQNGEATLALLQRLLTIVGDGNRKLGEVERRLAELEGRMRGSLNR